MDCGDERKPCRYSRWVGVMGTVWRRRARSGALSGQRLGREVCPTPASHQAPGVHRNPKLGRRPPRITRTHSVNHTNAGLPFRPLGLCLATALLLQACATTAPDSSRAKPTSQAAANTAAVPAPVAAAAAASPASAASGAMAMQGPQIGQPKPFDEVVKGATQQAGFVPVWRKDDKIWLEIPADRLEQPFLLSVNVASSVGERGLYASQMGPSWLATFRKIGTSHMQLLALNTSYVSGTAAMKSAVEQGFSNSLLGSAAIVSAPH